MALRLDVTLEDGTSKKMKVLVDTGAQINLIKSGLIPMREARRPVAFETADGSPMNGGEELTKLRVKLHKRGVRGDSTQTFELVDDFYNADIQYDLILSYPTLADHKMGVLPHRNALIMEEDGEDEPLMRWGEKETTSIDPGCPQTTSEKIQQDQGCEAFQQEKLSPVRGTSSTAPRTGFPLFGRSHTTKPNPNGVPGESYLNWSHLGSVVWPRERWVCGCVLRV